jgi:Fur family ferric uptake transcriptional regulator
MNDESTRQLPESEIARTEELFRQHLRLVGMNATNHRVAIMRAFLRAPGPISAQDLLYLVKRSDLFIASSTVRNTLKTFVACGLAKESLDPNGVTRYEHEHNPCTHRHLVCKDCGAVVEEQKQS